ncbi:hypothetical protein BS50DRAFT_573636 [Corynespora cassiicola Philippines]|uniref:Uncharacterized protein n=1 Tax=Corynespora cassiicola Philippines TaxID=1448308 RepID=A0A2T2NN80_CORCC|nr:hypothetical protein BS50DRAFT_573636 [Corynespora cassiicola Philippines]
MRKGLEQQLTLISPTRANTSSSLSMPVGHYKQMGVCRLLSPRCEMPGGDDPFFDEGSYTKITPTNNHVQALPTDVAHPVDILQTAPARKRKPRTRKGKGAKSLQKLPPIKETSFTDDGLNSIDSISSYELADDEVSSDSDLDISDDETDTIGVTRPVTGQIPVRGGLQHLENNLLDDLESGNFEKDYPEVHDYHDENEELRRQIQVSYEYMDLLGEQIDTMREIDRTDKFGKIAIGMEEETVKLKQIRKEALDMMSIDFKNINYLGSMSLETALPRIDDLRTRANNNTGRIHLIKEVEEKQLGHKKMKKELDNMDSEYKKMKMKYEDMMYREKTPSRSLLRRSARADIKKTYPFQEEDYETTEDGWYESSSDDQIDDKSTPTMRYASLAMVCSGKAKLVGAPTKDKNETASKDKSSDDSFHSVNSTNCNGSHIQPTPLQKYTSVFRAGANGGAESSSSDSKETFNRPRYVDAFTSTDSIAPKFHGPIGYSSALSGNGFYSTYYGGSGYAPSLTGGYPTRYPQPVSPYYQSVSGFNPNFKLGSQSTSTVSSGSIHQLKHKKGCVEKQASQFSTKNWIDGYNSTEQRPVSERLDPDVVADQETPPAVFPKEPPPVPQKSASRR